MNRVYINGVWYVGGYGSLDELNDALVACRGGAVRVSVVIGTLEPECLRDEMEKCIREMRIAKAERLERVKQARQLRPSTVARRPSRAAQLPRVAWPASLRAFA